MKPLTKPFLLNITFYLYRKSLTIDFVPSLYCFSFLEFRSRISLLYIKLLFSPFLLILSLAGFLPLSQPILPPWRKYTDPLVRLSVIDSDFSPTPKSTCLPLRVTFTHQSLSYFKRALRLPLSFPLASLAHHNPRICLKKKSWRSFYSCHKFTLNLQLPRERLILCPPKPPWSSFSHYSIS